MVFLSREKNKGELSLSVVSYSLRKTRNGADGDTTRDHIALGYYLLEIPGRFSPKICSQELTRPTCKDVGPEY